MDERIFQYKTGQPIPEWDLIHRLPINRPVGPECKDTATVFRINSTYMDVTEQPYMIKQLVAGATLLACGVTAACIWTQVVLYKASESIDGIFLILFLFNTLMAVGFAYITVRIGRDEFFSLTRRPIRFNRKEKKIYTIRRRRFAEKHGEGDITWEIPWNSDAIFCIHRNKNSLYPAYHIRHYTLDNDGKVLYAFAIGREWEGKENLEGLLSQWNYWCEYMNNGPADLPQPPLYFCEHEDARETFLFCMYEFGFTASTLARVIIMPMILIMTIQRMISLRTCRSPRWPHSVLAVSTVAMNDPYDQPHQNTPTGWAETAMAREYDGYPVDPKRKIDHWYGEPDGAKNAALWALDIPAAMPSTAA